MARPRKLQLEQEMWSKIAELEASGMMRSDIARAVALTPDNIRSLQRSKLYQELLVKAKEVVALNIHKTNLERLMSMSPLAMTCIENGLREGKVEFAKLWGRYMGYEKQEDVATKEPSLTIMFPHQQKPETTFVVNSEELKKEEEPSDDHS